MPRSSNLQPHCPSKSLSLLSRCPSFSTTAKRFLAISPSSPFHLRRLWLGFRSHGLSARYCAYGVLALKRNSRTFSATAMEVAASLPNIMKVFPLNIMMRERSPIPQQEAFLSGQAAATITDEEIEEGEIDPREEMFFSSSKEMLGVLDSVVVPVAAQHACNGSPPHFIEENAVMSATAHRLPRLSSVPDDMELEQSVEALLSLPDKLPLQGQSRFGTNDNILQFSSPPHSDRHCLSSSPYKKPEEGASFLKVSQRLSPVSCRKTCSTLTKLSQASDPKTQSSVTKQTPVPLLCASSSSKKPEACLSVKEPLVSSPAQRAERFSPSQANQPKTSSIVPTHQTLADFKQQPKSFQHCPDAFDKQHSRKPSSVDVDCQLSVAFEPSTQTLNREPLLNPHQQLVLGHSELSSKKLQTCSQMNFVASSAPLEGPSFPKQFAVSCTAVIGELQVLPEPTCLGPSIQHCRVSSLPREPPVRTSSSPKDHCPSSPIIRAPGSPSEREILTPLGSNGTQLDVPHVTSATTNSNDERAFISCANGKRRPRSSALRDYPEGCGRILPPTTNQLLVECSFSDRIHDKATLRVPDVKKCPLSGPSLVSRDEQGRKQNLVAPLRSKHKVGDTSCNFQHSVSRLDCQTALSLYKSPNASVLPLKRQTAQYFSPRKGENQMPTDYSLQTKPKKVKVWPLSRSLSCETKRLFSSSAEKSNEIQWFLEDELFGHGHQIKAVRPLKQWSRPRLPKSSSKLVPFLSQNPKGLEDALPPPDVECGTSSRFQVKRTLQEFDCVRRSLAMAKERYFRPDLAAAKILKKKGRWRNCGGEKIVGDVPGVEVGDQFSFRIEMLIVGLHRQVQGGIDYIAGSVRPRGPLATSIVASGGYEDDDDCGATFIYTGQGGNNYKGDRRQGSNQVLKRGNLALSNSFREKTPVRVIRGSTDDKFYTYDGLYDVIDFWFQTGVAGFGVYQYKLSRRPGQPELVSTIVKFMGSVKKKGLARPHLLLGDLSHGKERLPVSVVNEVDGEAAPEHFTYIPKMKYPSWYYPVLSRGCDCVGGCVDASKCLCALKNGGEFPYNELGQIVRGKKMVFECGKSCACPSSCYNRVSQKGSRHQLEVFKTQKRGWGVRSLEPIRPGDFIAEYTGELLSDADAERRTECDEYLFDIGHRTNTWMDVSDLMDINKGKATVPVVEDAGYTIDARLFGSVARFINHSCSPNLYAQDVVYDSDVRFPHVLLFAMENIPPMRELSYDYNYTIGHVRDANGDVKAKACYCGAQDCRGRLY